MSRGKCKATDLWRRCDISVVWGFAPHCGTLQNWAHARGVGPPYPPAAVGAPRGGLPPAWPPGAHGSHERKARLRQASGGGRKLCRASPWSRACNNQ